MVSNGLTPKGAFPFEILLPLSKLNQRTFANHCIRQLNWFSPKPFSLRRLWNNLKPKTIWIAFWEWLRIMEDGFGIVFKMFLWKVRNFNFNFLVLWLICSAALVFLNKEFFLVNSISFSVLLQKTGGARFVPQTKVSIDVCPYQRLCGRR